MCGDRREDESGIPQIEVTPAMIEAAMDEYAEMWAELWEYEPEACVTRLLRRALSASCRCPSSGSAQTPRLPQNC